MRTYGGLIARIIQHEYDHIDGVLFIDRISPLKRNLIKGKLNKVRNNKISQIIKLKYKADAR